MGSSANNWGLNDNYNYFEYVFDSSDTFGPAFASNSKTDWPLFNFGRTISDLAAIKILEVQIPFSWYVFNSVISNFELRENGGGVAIVTIPPGNYNVTTLGVALKAALEAVSPNDWTVTYNQTTGKFTFVSSDPGVSASFTFTFTNADLNYYLGFNEQTGIAFSSSTEPTPTLSSTGYVNVSGPNYLYINSNKFGNMVNFFLPVGPDTNGNVGPEICKVPVNCLPGEVIFWQDPDPEKWFDIGGLASLNSMDMYLGLGKSIAEDPLQLNGQPFSVKLGVLVQKRTHNEFVGSNAGSMRVERRNVPN